MIWLSRELTPTIIQVLLQWHQKQEQPHIHHTTARAMLDRDLIEPTGRTICTTQNSRRYWEPEYQWTQTGVDTLRNLL